MADVFDITRFRNSGGGGEQYRFQLKRLAEEGKSTEAVELAVNGALRNMRRQGSQKSFVIYGEPQSGKTEMMICLTARLLDEGYNFIVHMLNDSLDLLDQNLGRFQGSGLAPAAQDFMGILDPGTDLNSGSYVVFSKKNAANLKKLIAKLDGKPGVVVIDDEADYASPNSKVNLKDKTTINRLVGEVIGETGHYIGVTATPARLNLNNTFGNDSALWVYFPPHPAYTGQDTFFPMDLYSKGLSALEYRLTLLPDKGDDPKYEREALCRFLVNVAHLNLSTGKEQNYSMLIHTSGQMVDHKLDLSTIKSTLAVLKDSDHSKFESLVKYIWDFARETYLDIGPNEITEYIVKNVSRSSTIVMNSDKEFKKVGKNATNPVSLFTIVVGGNIVSRGVTLNNLLSMFFTRDVKHRLQQDTYIQRARMFGSRNSYLHHFELTIPRNLFFDWHRCFVYHRLALASINSNLGSPVWIADKRIAAVSSPSIDQSTVDMDKGEMSFAIFDYDSKLDAELESASTIAEKIEALASFLPEASFPAYLRSFILQSTTQTGKGLKVFETGDVFPSMTPEEKDKIERRRGFLTIREQDRAGGNVHFLRVFKNNNGRARLFYKLDGGLQFMKNLG